MEGAGFKSRSVMDGHLSPSDSEIKLGIDLTRLAKKPCEVLSSQFRLTIERRRIPMEKLLKDGLLCKLLEKVDDDLAEEARQEGCVHCGEAKLHRGDYTRQPLGGPGWDKRRSFNCARVGCRKRKTPPSVRFLGRKVYAGVVVVLVSAMMHGLSQKRVERLRQELGIDSRTLKRWRLWWLEHFGKT